MSEHVFTSSIFTAKASSNDMKAALANYRARAGHIGEDNSFYFPSARRSSRYQHHLIIKAFKKYCHFEMSVKAASTPCISGSEVSDKTNPNDIWYSTV